jgi:hypothetical protein
MRWSGALSFPSFQTLTALISRIAAKVGMSTRSGVAQAE